MAAGAGRWAAAAAGRRRLEVIVELEPPLGPGAQVRRIEDLALDAQLRFRLLLKVHLYVD